MQELSSQRCHGGKWAATFIYRVWVTRVGPDRHLGLVAELGPSQLSHTNPREIQAAQEHLCRLLDPVWLLVPLTLPCPNTGTTTVLNIHIRHLEKGLTPHSCSGVPVPTWAPSSGLAQPGSACQALKVLPGLIYTVERRHQAHLDSVCHITEAVRRSWVKLVTVYASALQEKDLGCAHSTECNAG